MRRILEKTLNSCLALDATAPVFLQQLTGKRIKIRIHSLFDLNFCLQFDAQGIRILDNSESLPADASIIGTPIDILRSSKDVLAAKRLQLEGDLSLIQTLQRWLTLASPDIEALLAQWTGDVLAHSLMTPLRQLRKQGQDRFVRLHQNGREYLQEEYNVLPSALETEDFLQDVDRLRDDCERLMARLQRLQTLSQSNQLKDSL